jgi:hypothetical protein
MINSGASTPPDVPEPSVTDQTNDFQSITQLTDAEHAWIKPSPADTDEAE